MNWAADHIVPFFITGRTDVAEMQALCQSCNSSKGASTVGTVKKSWVGGDRDWQNEAFQKWRQMIKEKNDYLLVATPGAGKTQFALRTAHSLLEERRVQRVVVVVPTDHLRRQWSVAAAKVGIPLTGQLENRLLAKYAREPDDVCGSVVTYSQVAMSPEVHAVACARYRTYVILDEIHHAGDDRDWGKSLRHSFDRATLRLCMSGTAFRSDNSPIPFITYDQSRSVPDFEYGYEDALRDGVCRSVVFPTYEGTMEWFDELGEFREAQFADDLDDRGCSRRLVTALKADGQHVKKIIEDANEQLMSLRSCGHNKAGGLVIAMDHDHANEIATKIIQAHLGVSPVVVTCDKPNASKLIERFARSSDPWIVAVRMVSEGVDIPRLRVGVYATNVVAELFFRQAVGRFVRTIPDLEEQTAYLYCPKDPRLVRYVEQIKEERDHVLRERDRETPSPRQGDGGDGHLSREWSPVSSTGDFDVVIHEGSHYRSDLIERVRRMKSSGRLSTAVSKLPDHILAEMITELEGGGTGVATTVVDAVVTRDDKKTQLTTLITKLVGRISKRTGLTHKEVHARWKRLGGKEQAALDVPGLRQKVKFLSDWMKRT